MKNRSKIVYSTLRGLIQTAHSTRTITITQDGLPDHYSELHPIMKDFPVPSHTVSISVRRLLPNDPMQASPRAANATSCMQRQLSRLRSPLWVNTLRLGAAEEMGFAGFAAKLGPACLWIGDLTGVT